MAVATTAREQATWYALDAVEVASQLGVDVHKGLSTAEATARREQYGPNKFAEAESEPRWHAFLRQYKDLMQVVLLVVGGKK